MKDRTQKRKNLIVGVFTVFAYVMFAPVYAEHPYAAVAHWIVPFTFEMLFISGLLWVLLRDWKRTLGSLSVLAFWVVLLGACLFVVLFLFRQITESPFRTIVVIFLVVIIALLYKISERLQRNA